ncbi:MAG: CRISPR-associated endonuclease Cas1, partial [Nitrososphaerota archaeon]|nr:CRISPR-associated endonuclease Cas1 [Nitrososphaerota archaeon]
MNPLYIDSSVASISCDRYSLIIQDKKTNRIIEKFKPRDIPYDSIIIQRPNGYITFSAVYWLVKHAISLTVLNWRGSILAQFLPEEPISNKLKLAQYQAYLDKERHLDIAKTLVETKLWRQREFLKALSNSYEIEIPSIEKINSKSTDFMRNQEARYAVSYFAEFGKACKVLGYEFKKRNVSGNNMHAPDLPNGLLNYSYAILQTYVKRAIN